ncbi:MBL fold metallo-hydrolase [Paenibacillus sp. IB182493]|uniref:MBL fold metallo-hydrolase n=2 Tax=Paenibacillus arenilitoris TaxID=2772299 RepID=A0A927H4P8_9BACL|nr:MBL fold metallo-hydrolase [Paenibacillus arenilitoris]
MLTVTASMMGKAETIHPTLIWDRDTVLLADTGYPGQLPLIRAELEKSGVALGRLNKIVITHQDLDHLGTLPALLSELPRGQAEVLATAAERPYIQGEKQLIKITPEAVDLAAASLPPEVPDEWRAAFRRTLEHPPSAPVDAVIEPGMVLPYCGGISVIGTPGHTPGHISLYHRPTKTLIAADALIVEDGRLFGPDPRHCVDPQLAYRSIQALTAYDIEAVICYHGGIYNLNVNERIQELADLRP